MIEKGLNLTWQKPRLGVLQLKIFIRELIPIDRNATSSISSGEVASLAPISLYDDLFAYDWLQLTTLSKNNLHEVAYNAMEFAAFIALVENNFKPLSWI